MPKKIKLNLNDLDVKSFKTSEVKGGDVFTALPCDGRGTVLGHCSQVAQACRFSDTPVDCIATMNKDCKTQDMCYLLTAVNC